MATRAFKQVDVFTATPYSGNPLAVVLDASGLDGAAMQRFAAWTNLSETTFIQPPQDAAADYRVRIFTPAGELPFAGHPTLGSCHSWLEAGGQAKDARFVVQECAAGLVKIRYEAGSTRLAFAAPALKSTLPDAALLTQVAEALGVQERQITGARLLNNGPVWLGLLLDSPETVLQLLPNHLALAKLGVKVGVAGIYPADEEPPLIARANREARAFGQTAAVDEVATRLEVRGFAVASGIIEDPVTGSLNASLAQWLIAEGLLPERYLASQGVCMGRAGLVHLERDPQGQVWVGGDSVTCVSGSVRL